ncbi:hypothetical protein OVY01_14150 [Robbsia sp. Bb-Pol-6]|uniref:Transmembrane protein n=1 Tax=Robbsia betulipollinis TaxID=2981849 RepID=A0ABT3ZPA6_9BURK|nr:hypothetical protein [Robbsia betulipollinis]MCY0388360.1 hypothetical protein [Robbsia betulipollinis]
MNEFQRRKAHAEDVETIDATEVADLHLDDARARQLRGLSHILYGLYALAWFTGGVSGIVALIIDYVKRGDAGQSLYASHANWRIRTFWWSLLWLLLSLPFLLIHIGYLFLVVIWIWGGYRVIKGWLRLFELRPVP